MKSVENFQNEQRSESSSAEVRRQEALARIQELMKRHESELAQAIEEAFAEISTDENEELKKVA